MNTIILEEEFIDKNIFLMYLEEKQCSPYQALHILQIFARDVVFLCPIIKINSWPKTWFLVCCIYSTSLVQKFQTRMFSVLSSVFNRCVETAKSTQLFLHQTVPTRILCIPPENLETQSKLTFCKVKEKHFQSFFVP